MEQARPGDQASQSRLNTAVAIAVATLATFMGICKFKDDNVVEVMQQAQADKIDHWAFYLARQIREEVARSTVVQLQLARANRAATEQTAYDVQITEYRRVAEDLKPYANLNFDPNDAITLGLGWHQPDGPSISVFAVRDDRVVPGQQITHLVARATTGRTACHVRCLR